MNTRVNFIFLVAIAALAFAVGGCSPSDATAMEILEDEGYENIRLTGWEPFSCGKDDDMNTGFVASRTVHGAPREVSGVVCCGWLKDCTVRH